MDGAGGREKGKGKKKKKIEVGWDKEKEEALQGFSGVEDNCAGGRKKWKFKNKHHSS